MQSFFEQNQYQFTGYEHTRLSLLLLILAVASFAMWIVVVASIALRHIMILRLKRSGHHGHRSLFHILYGARKYLKRP